VIHAAASAAASATASLQQAFASRAATVIHRYEAPLLHSRRTCDPLPVWFCRRLPLREVSCYSLHGHWANGASKECFKPQRLPVQSHSPGCRHTVGNLSLRRLHERITDVTIHGTHSETRPSNHHCTVNTDVCQTTTDHHKQLKWTSS
jgi:hypothetical protein